MHFQIDASLAGWRCQPIRWRLRDQSHAGFEASILDSDTKTPDTLVVCLSGRTNWLTDLTRQIFLKNRDRIRTPDRQTHSKSWQNHQTEFFGKSGQISDKDRTETVLSALICRGHMRNWDLISFRDLSIIFSHGSFLAKFRKLLQKWPFRIGISSWNSHFYTEFVS